MIEANTYINFYLSCYIISPNEIAGVHPKENDKVNTYFNFYLSCYIISHNEIASVHLKENNIQGG